MVRFCVCVFLVLFASTLAQPFLSTPFNGDFESGDLSGWSVEDLPSPLTPVAVGSVSQHRAYFPLLVPEGVYTLYHGFDGGPEGFIDVFRDIQFFPTTKNVLLTFSYRIRYDLQCCSNGATSRFFQVLFTIGGSVTTVCLHEAKGDTVVDTGLQSASIQVPRAALTGSPTVELRFRSIIPQSYTGPALLELDNIRFEEGVQSVQISPCTNPVCHPSCRTCRGPTQTECTSCDEGYTFNSGTCTPNSCHPSCVTCTTTMQDSCLSCTGDFALRPVPGGNVCASRSCTASCKFCLQADPSECVECGSTAQFITPKSSSSLGGTCRYWCADGMYEAEKYCEPCAFECRTCWGPSRDMCWTCQDGYFYYDDTCATSCPDGFWPNGDANVCSPCSHHCSTCSGFDVCTACAQGYALQDGDCVLN